MRWTGQTHPRCDRSLANQSNDLDVKRTAIDEPEVNNILISDFHFTYHFFKTFDCLWQLITNVDESTKEYIISEFFEAADIVQSIVGQIHRIHHIAIEWSHSTIKAVNRNRVWGERLRYDRNWSKLLIQTHQNIQYSISKPDSDVKYQITRTHRHRNE